ncbi:hypothetical protein BO71DRAFT_444104 [Aspergillus ellipticus CBS 707.79]|uniref:Uncharacterized protein n=1 Tax=Aspergillus ellipticus CBS 707.79 TaxID=1448320 RepID=A0A319CZP5_9EURO|nr:hypothetical protein BO71DRAFT_444104 [Aspergillus ellipticus CBS 707.79]
MDSIREQARNGTLNETTLWPYLECIDAADNNGLTPLIHAVLGGHLETVNLLLHHRAEAKKTDKRGRSALCLAASRSQASLAGRPQIIRSLLAHDAEVEAKGGPKESTPLMLVIERYGDIDLDSVRELLRSHGGNNGASLTQLNKFGETALDIAERKRCPRVVNILRQTSGRHQTSGGLAEVIRRIINLLLYLLSWFNMPLLSGSRILNGWKSPVGSQNRLQNQSLPPSQSRPYIESPPPPLSGPSSDAAQPEQPPKPPPQQAELTPPATPTPETTPEIEYQQEYQKINEYMDRNNLKRFFSMDSNLIGTIAKKAIDLRKDTTTTLGNKEKLPKMIQLAMYKPIIYCDDSGSMKQNSHHDSQIAIVERIARITTRLIPDNMGVDLRFINNKQTYDNLSEADINEKMKGITLLGSTELGHNLKNKILEPLIYEAADRGTLERPFLVFIITDGAPSAEKRERKNPFRDVVRKCRKEMLEREYPEYAVTFQISQVGGLDDAERFLDESRGDEDMKDFIYCTSDRLDVKYAELRKNEKMLEEWMLETLIEPILRWGPDYM